MRSCDFTARIEIGTQIMARDARFAFDGEDVFGGEWLMIAKPLVNRRLAAANQATECGLRSAPANRFGKRCVYRRFDTHAAS